MRLPCGPGPGPAPSSFWDPDPSLPIRPPVTAAAVREAERVLGMTLPEALPELLRVRDGGVVSARHNAFPTSAPTSWSADHVPLDHLMGAGPDPDRHTLLDTPHLVEEWGLPSPVVLLDGDGHCWIGLDHRHSGPHGEPSVVWLDAELDTELPLAPDFRTFLNGLLPESAFTDGP